MGCPSGSRAFAFKCNPIPFPLSSVFPIDSKPRRLPCFFSSCASRSLAGESRMGENEEGSCITCQEWRNWGTASPLPAMVEEIAKELKALEKDVDAQMSFGGNGGKLQGYFKDQEDKKHRATYQTLGDPEKKIQFYSARQVACRLLGSRDYLCQKCWLALEDCMCLGVNPCSLWHGMRFWLYMHPKDFLRQNNTGKLLWQVFGVEAATLCLFGIAEHEDIMWNSFKRAGKSKVWCLYPNTKAVSKSVQEAIGEDDSTDAESLQLMKDEDRKLNFILIDGTWSNSAAMFRRLKEQAKSVWGEEDIPCISLATGVSAMHKLRPQPSWDRTCTAGAAIGLLSEMQSVKGLSSLGLDKQGEAIENALVVLLNSLTSRRLRMGRSITRKVRHNSFVS